MKSPPSTGKYAPLKEAHARIQAEIDARKEGAAGKEIKSAALEVRDKDMVPARKAAAPSRASASAQPAQAQDQSEQRAVRPERRAPRPAWVLQGMGPGGNETYTRAGRMRAVRLQAADSEKASTQKNTLRAEAERLFTQDAKVEKGKPEVAGTKSSEEDAGQDIDR